MNIIFDSTPSESDIYLAYSANYKERQVYFNYFNIHNYTGILRQWFDLNEVT